MTSRPRRSPADPYGIGPVGPLVAPVAALVGLLIVAVVTMGLINGRLPLPAGGSNGGNGPDDAPKTPAPSNVVIVDPKTEVAGTIVYAKAGNVWIHSGTDVRQITGSGRASMPTWSPDGQWIYYIESVSEIGRFPARGEIRPYRMTYPDLMRIRADGTGAERIVTGRFERGSYTWFHWIRQPDVSPDGRTIALVSDGPDPTKRNVVVQLYDLETGESSVPKLAETAPLGHQDPAWRPDGQILAYVKNGRDGARGAPAIFRYEPSTAKSAAITGPGYTAPSWSPDGRYLAATRTTSLGTDVVILDARTGAELLRLTDDDRSWSPVWSPKGDEIAFLQLDGGLVDLRLIRLEGTAPAWTPGEVQKVTEVSGLDGASRPDWFVPADQLPPPTPSPAASAAPSGPPASP